MVLFDHRQEGMPLLQVQCDCSGQLDRSISAAVDEACNGSKSYTIGRVAFAAVQTSLEICERRYWLPLGSMLFARIKNADQIGRVLIAADSLGVEFQLARERVF